MHSVLVINFFLEGVNMAFKYVIKIHWQRDATLQYSSFATTI